MTIFILSSSNPSDCHKLFKNEFNMPVCKTQFSLSSSVTWQLLHHLNFSRQLPLPSTSNISNHFHSNYSASILNTPKDLHSHRLTVMLEHIAMQLDHNENQQKRPTTEIKEEYKERRRDQNLCFC